MTYAVLNQQSGTVIKHCAGPRALERAMAIAAQRHGREIWECCGGEPCYLVNPSAALANRNWS